MPRYFFHVIDGHDIPDPDGTELPDRSAARAQALRASGEILRDMGQDFWDETKWRMEVADESGELLFVLRFAAEEASPSSV